MSALEVFAFEGNGVRTVTVDGEVLFSARDVAAALGFIDTVNAVKQHCKGVAIHHPLPTGRGLQASRVITEADVLRLIVSSRLPSALKFERWLFEEVLPAIRKTGSYSVAPALPQDYPSALRELAASFEARVALEAKVTQDAPKVLFADAVATSDSTILIGDLAKILRGNGVDIGANRLFAQLREDGYLIRRRGSDWNMPTQKAMDLGLFKVKETAVTHSDGHVTVSKTPKVTGKGQAYFVSRLVPALV